MVMGVRRLCWKDDVKSSESRRLWYVNCSYFVTQNHRIIVLGSFWPFILWGSPWIVHMVSSLTPIESVELDKFKLQLILQLRSRHLHESSLSCWMKQQHKNVWQWLQQFKLVHSHHCFYTWISNFKWQLYFGIHLVSTSYTITTAFTSWTLQSRLWKVI